MPRPTSAPSRAWRSATREARRLGGNRPQLHRHERAPSTSGLEGYIVARVFVDALNRAGTRAGREQLVAALEATKLDLGGIEVAFSPTNREGTSFVELLIIAKGGRLKK